MKAELEQEAFVVILGNAKADDDTPLLAYSCKGDLPYTKQCWIPVIPNQPFCIHYALSDSVQLPLGGELEGAGIFCELYIDGEITERAFLPLSDGVREWEITGKYYRGERGEPHKERPFRFGFRIIDPDSPNMLQSGGTICVILYWAKPNPNKDNPYPIPSDALANALGERFSRPVTKDESGRYRYCVRLGEPVETEVIENNMQVEAVDDKRYAFVFRYAHPEWLVNQRIKPSSGAPSNRGTGRQSAGKDRDDGQKC